MAKTEAARPGRKPSPEKRAAIIEAARELFARYGVDAATTREIAARAETTERTLFKHFGSKDALVQEVVEEVSIALIREVAFRRVTEEKAFTAAEFAAWHRDFLKDRMTAAETLPDSYKILFRELLRDDSFRKSYGANWLDRVFAPLAKHLEKMQRSGEIAKEQSPRALAGAFFSLNLGYLVSRYALAPKMQWANDRDAKTIASLFMATCGAKASR
jgi:AcrR family transcriptional regulator